MTQPSKGCRFVKGELDDYNLTQPGVDDAHTYGYP